MGTVAKQSFFNSINAYFGVALGALNTMILFPRIFDPEVYGDFQNLMAQITIVSTFAHLGFPTALVVFFPKLNREKRAALWTYMITYISIVSIFLALSLALLQKYEIIQITRLQFGLIACISIVYFELFSALSQFHSKILVPQFVRNVFRRVIISVGLALSFWLDDGSHSFYLVFGIGYLLHLIIVVWYARPELPKFTWQPQEIEGGKTLRYGFMVMLAAGALIVVSRIDILMIKSMLGSAEVAFYHIAFFFGSVVAVPVKSVIASVRPFVAKAWAREDFEEIAKLYRKSAQNQLAITGFLLLLIVVNLDLVTWILPPKYHFEAFPVVVLFIGLSEVIKGATGINGMILTVSEKQHFNFYSGLVLIILTIIGNWLLIPFLGLSGAALASLGALSLFNFFKLYLVKRLYNLIPTSREFWLLAISLSLGLFALWQMQLRLDWPLWLKLVSGNSLALILLLLLFRFSSSLDDFKVFKFLKG